MAMWMRDPNIAVAGGEVSECLAARLWRSACTTLCAPAGEDAWRQLAAVSASPAIWHSLPNCIDYQAGVWQGMLSSGMPDVVQPAAFKLALVLRHTPPDLSVKLLAELLKQHPQSQDLTSYILALLTDDEALISHSPPQSPSPSPPGPAPVRDLQLFADCELSVLAASQEQYDAHADLVRAEYTDMSRQKYVELRIKILNQLCKIPKLYHTPEFEPLEAAARLNIERELNTLREKSSSASRC